MEVRECVLCLPEGIFDDWSSENNDQCVYMTDRVVYEEPSPWERAERAMRSMM